MNTEAMGCVNSIKNPEQGVFNLWKKGQISQEGKDVRRFCSGKMRRPKPGWNLIWILP